jgi:Na+/melibiose symporter-like transporter
VDRLEEYHSDENLGYSIFGVLLGAAFGVIVNWSTDPNQPASAISIVMFIFYLLIAGGILVWLIRIRNRKRDVKEEMDRSST